MIYNLIGKEYNGIPFIEPKDMKIVGFKRLNDDVPYKLQVIIDKKSYWYKLDSEEG